ncbi:hypothetical protein F4778DRAFT_776981 [Xylariomycetidae sp. FL2044]|nr:hypothetical protein F4778DRAFT_776981 [Xylariomycetidae sp. FL2044]
MSFGTRSHQPQIYFCPYLDTLYLPRPPFMGYDDDSRSFRQLVTDTEDIANLALDHVRPAIRRPWETYNKYALMQSFSKVHEVYLILSSERMEDQEPHGSLSLADPAGDVLDLCRLLSDVKESFAYEVGASYKADKEQELLFAQPTLPDLVLKAKVMPGVEGYGMHVSAAA